MAPSVGHAHGACVVPPARLYMWSTGPIPNIVPEFVLAAYNVNQLFLLCLTVRGPETARMLPTVSRAPAGALRWLSKAVSDFEAAARDDAVAGANRRIRSHIPPSGWQDMTTLPLPVLLSCGWPMRPLPASSVRATWVEPALGRDQQIHSRRPYPKALIAVQLYNHTYVSFK